MGERLKSYSIGPALDPDAVDFFILEDRAMRARERAGSEAGALEMSDMNVISDPIPVRVDAKMRPDR